MWAWFCLTTLSHKFCHPQVPVSTWGSLLSTTSLTSWWWVPVELKRISSSALHRPMLAISVWQEKNWEKMESTGQYTANVNNLITRWSLLTLAVYVVIGVWSIKCKTIFWGWSSCTCCIMVLLSLTCPSLLVAHQKNNK